MTALIMIGIFLMIAIIGLLFLAGAGELNEQEREIFENENAKRTPPHLLVFDETEQKKNESEKQ